MTDLHENIRKALSHEIWAAAQLAPGEGIVDGVARVEALLRKAAHPAITHCDNCGCDWLDNGLNPVGCPYCKQSAETEALRAEVERLNRYYKNGIDCFANPCERHSGERTPPFSEFFEKYGGQCLICVVDNNKALQAENERLAEALAVLITWIPSADTYRRLGFNPEAPMRVLEDARAALAHGGEG